MRPFSSTTPRFFLTARKYRRAAYRFSQFFDGLSSSVEHAFLIRSFAFLSLFEERKHFPFFSTPYTGLSFGVSHLVAFLFEIHLRGFSPSTYFAF